MLQDFLKQTAYRFGFSLRRMRGVKTRSGALGSASLGNDGEALLHAIHAVDPYAGFAYQTIPFEAQGWGSQSPAFGTLVARIRPHLIIEVGTWKGGSAMEMATHLERHALTASRILCIDTWLGALEMWGDHTEADRYGSLALKHGYPQLYYQFLANVCHQGLQPRIIPFPLPSVTAAQWLSLRGVRAELIYLDGSHEEEDVDADLTDYWDLLAPGGVIFGDDYAWTGVRMAVDRFTAEHRLHLEHLEDKWLLAKAD
ncbi:MAG: class I SAM-dependent methyltransferase [Verrucomicrobia bacterium]|nr:class I SAM-dependent methyltransferase [Verrucomicrobiota bacterium]